MEITKSINTLSAGILTFLMLEHQKNALMLALKRGHFELSKLLVKHCILLKSKGLCVSEWNLNAAKGYPKISEFQEACVKEVELLRAVKFTDSGLSYFDVLRTEDVDKLAALASNVNILKALKSDSFLGKL